MKISFRERINFCPIKKEQDKKNELWTLLNQCGVIQDSLDSSKDLLFPISQRKRKGLKKKINFTRPENGETSCP